VAALTPRVFSTPRGRVEAAVAGSGPALLVVHGMPGDWRQARVLSGDLSGDATVVLVSRPGYGRTPLSSGRSPADQALLYDALLEELGLGPAVVLGISGGGPSAFALAALRPGRCAGLVLACAVRPGVMQVPAAMRRLAAVPGLWSVLALLARRRPGSRELDLSVLTERERELLADRRVREAAEVFEAERWLTLRGRGMRNDARRLGDPAPTWPAVGPPVLVLHGDRDEVVPVACAHAYAEAVPGARLEVLSGLGHAVPVFARDALVAELRGLLAGSRRQ
jgi:pimeloyl-ACP methyl ester carboxylesterase